MRVPFRHVLIALLAAALPLSSCRRPAQREAEETPPLPVIAEPVRMGTIASVISATGVVEGLQSARHDIRTERPARIAEILKDAGDAVVAGEPLVRFEFPALNAQMAAGTATLKTAQARANASRLQRDRVAALISRGAASQAELDEATRQVESAEAEVTAAGAALQLADAQSQAQLFRAPFNAIVLERFNNPGDFVQPDAQNPILRLIDPREVQVQAIVPVADAARFTVGATARAVAEGRAAADLMKVTSRPQPEAAAKTVPITLTFEVPTELPLGTQVGLEIDGEQRLNVPLVPAVAVLKDDRGETFLMIAEGDVARRRPVTLGLAAGDQVEIRSGVKTGELVITQGHTAMRDGTAISVSPP